MVNLFKADYGHWHIADNQIYTIRFSSKQISDLVAHTLPYTFHISGKFNLTIRLFNLLRDQQDMKENQFQVNKSLHSAETC